MQVMTAMTYEKGEKSNNKLEVVVMEVATVIDMKLHMQHCTQCNTMQ